MNFTELFKHFPYTKIPDSTIFQFEENSRIVTYSKEKEIKSNNQSNTIAKIKQLVNDWDLFKKLEEDDKAKILNILKFENNTHKTTVKIGDIRSIYQNVIAFSLKNDFEKVGAASPEYESFFKFWKKKVPSRIVLNEEKRPLRVPQKNYDLPKKLTALQKKELIEKSKLANKDAIEAYLKMLENNWGKKRVARALECSEVNFTHMIEKGFLFKSHHIRQINTALNDVHLEDVNETYLIIKRAIDNSDSQLLDLLPLRIREKLHHYEESEHSHEILQKLKRFQSLPNNFTDLKDSNMQSYFIGLIASNYNELEKSLLGSRMEGVMLGGYPSLNWQSILYNKHLEDKERIQVYQEIYKMNGSWEEWETGYIELLSKFLIKKEICRHNGEHDIQSGMLIPAPCGEWYRIEKKFSKNGKHALFLTPIFHKDKRPSMIIYMSTASAPAHTHAPETIAHDATPNAPGHFGRHLDDEDVLEFYSKNTSTSLIIAGHSLGGTFAQYRVHDTLKQYLNKDNDLDLINSRNMSLMKPHRPIKLVCFDAPAIRKADTIEFLKLVTTYKEIQKQIELIYYISENDIIPGGGHYHLGFECHETKVKIKFNLINNKENHSEPELNILPHGRIYFSSRKVRNQTHMKEGNGNALNDFDKATWRRNIEIFRLFVAFILLPLALLYLTIKYTIIGISEWYKNRKIKQLNKEMIPQAI